MINDLYSTSINQIFKSPIVNYKSAVGGIYYNPIKSQPQVDIYGNAIDFSNLVTYSHEPIYTGNYIEGGYQQRYNLDFNDDVVPESVEKTTDSIVPKTTTKLTGKDGFKKLIKLYELALDKRGIDKNYAKWLASKDALETGWGLVGHGAEHLNYGNITAGSSWSGKTYEGGDRDAKGNKIKQKFREYNSIEDYIDDQLNLYTNSNRYKNIFVGDVSGFADRLYQAGYAEDPEYAKKVKSVYNSW